MFSLTGTSHTILSRSINNREFYNLVQDTNYCRLEELYLQLKRKLHEKRENEKYSKRSKNLYLTTEKCTYFIEGSVGRSVVRVTHLSASE